MHMYEAYVYRQLSQQEKQLKNAKVNTYILDKYVYICLCIYEVNTYIFDKSDNCGIVYLHDIHPCYIHLQIHTYTYRYIHTPTDAYIHIHIR